MLIKRFFFLKSAIRKRKSNTTLRSRRVTDRVCRDRLGVRCRRFRSKRIGPKTIETRVKYFSCFRRDTLDAGISDADGRDTRRRISFATTCER